MIVLVCHVVVRPLPFGRWCEVVLILTGIPGRGAMVGAERVNGMSGVEFRLFLRCVVRLFRFEWSEFGAPGSLVRIMPDHASPA
ncbi:MAG TPA: hypothetical protein VIS09_15670 [Streptomyces sp.]